MAVSAVAGVEWPNKEKRREERVEGGKKGKHLGQRLGGRDRRKSEERGRGGTVPETRKETAIFEFGPTDPSLSFSPSCLLGRYYAEQRGKYYFPT